MIQKQHVDGRAAVVAFLNDKFEPVETQSEATLLKVTFIDPAGGAIFLVPTDAVKPEMQ